MAFQIIRNDITKVCADAIVNTANPEVRVGRGVDFAIYEAAGSERLLEARRKIGRLEAGEVKATPAFDLPANYIFHACGPVWQGGTHGEPELLRRCYDNALTLAKDCDCKSIAFPLMAAGTYGFPKELGMQIAVESFRDFLEENELEIILAVFESDAYKISGNLYEDVHSFIDDRGVERAINWEYRLSASMPMAASVLLESELPEHKSEKVPREKLEAESELPEHKSEKVLRAKRSLFSASKGISQFKKAAVQPDALNVGESLDEQLKHMYTDSFEKHLQQLINKKGLKNSQVYAAANISKQYFSKLMKGQVKPSKEKVLSLAVGLQLNPDEATDFLRIAGYAFSPVSQTDVIVEYFIRKREYNVMKIDVVLFDYGLPLLSE